LKAKICPDCGTFSACLFRFLGHTKYILRERKKRRDSFSKIVK
jgi:hypothetical protein